MKLWDKGERALTDVERYTVGEDRELDGRLIGHDILGSLAHAACLKKAGILSTAEFAKLRKALGRAYRLCGQGKFRVRKRDEDMHTRIEEYLTERLGSLGKKIHTGRSRNDQVLTALRLYQKEHLLAAIGAALDLAAALTAAARRHQRVPMPGYTHMRKAMVTTVGHWLAAHAESLLDSVTLLEAALALVDACPLGSASGYGVNLPLDRTLAANLLGFRRVQNNSLTVQNSRGKFDAAILSALADVMTDLQRLAADLVLFSMPEFGYVTLPPELCTGSSLMPQKRNPDVLELIRANGAVVASYESRVRQILHGAISGYNRDAQLTKGPLIRGFEVTESSLAMMALVVERMTIDRARCRAACTEELFATDAAIELARKGVPFREAYRRVAAERGRWSGYDPLRTALARQPLGSPGNLGLDRLVRMIAKGRVATDRAMRSLRITYRQLVGA